MRNKLTLITISFLSLFYEPVTGQIIYQNNVYNFQNNKIKNKKYTTVDSTYTQLKNENYSLVSQAIIDSLQSYRTTICTLQIKLSTAKSTSDFNYCYNLLFEKLKLLNSFLERKPDTINTGSFTKTYETFAQETELYILFYEKMMDIKTGLFERDIDVLIIKLNDFCTSLDGFNR